MLEVMIDRQLLDELAIGYGVVLDYYDIWGRYHRIGSETLRAILAAMGVRSDTDEDLRNELAELHNAPWRQPCDPTLVIRAEGGLRLWSLRVPADEAEDANVRVRWELRDESGQLRYKSETGPGIVPVESRFVDGQRYIRLELPLPPALPIGYYDLVAYAITPSRFIDGMLRLILVPDQCFVPPAFLEGKTTWGIALQLYALRSTHNWGVGDFTDLAELAAWAAKDLKAGLIGVNPLHALKNSRPHHISPYSPDSRLYLNLLYIDVERIPDYKDSQEARQLVESHEFSVLLQELRSEELVDYDRIVAAKIRVLDACFATFWSRHMSDGAELRSTTSRGEEFIRYIREEGEGLEAYALFQALTETMRHDHPDKWVWHEWPEIFQHPRSPAVAAFRTSHEPRLRFYQYVQWVAGVQLRDAACTARSLGMPVGLYHDLALGSDRSGVDAWVFQDVFALNADCGCPPDAFAPEGQNWGLPPVNPHRLRATCYRMFVQMLRHNLRFGGALRMDHVMALFRLFWIPRGMPASAGAYVQYPVEDLLGILALESVRHRAMIVGEDLGTVPDEVRVRLSAARVLSYRVFYFERLNDGTWKLPNAYPEQALAVVTTHDLPTLSGFWAGEDIEARSKLGGYPDDAAKRTAWETRYQDKVKIWDILKREGLLPPGLPNDLAAVPRMIPELSTAIHAYLARTSSWLVLAALDDIAGEVAQTNFPGTVDEYPNWSRKLSMPIESLRLDPRPKQLAASLNALRPME